MNHLVSYCDTTHPYYLLTCFIEGLRADIRAVVMVQRPTDLDTACSLALLQEEVMEGESISPPRLLEHWYIIFPRKPVPALQPAAPTTSASHASDNRGMDSARNSGNDRLYELRNYRKATGPLFQMWREMES
jgi:hypothetical protein